MSCNCLQSSSQGLHALHGQMTFASCFNKTLSYTASSNKEGMTIASCFYKTLSYTAFRIIEGIYKYVLKVDYIEKLYQMVHSL